MCSAVEDSSFAAFLRCCVSSLMKTYWSLVQKVRVVYKFSRHGTLYIST